MAETFSRTYLKIGSDDVFGSPAGCGLDWCSFDDFRSSLSSFGMTFIGPMLKGVIGLAANEVDMSYYNMKSMIKTINKSCPMSRKKWKRKIVLKRNIK